MESLPDGFVLHRQVSKILEDRHRMAAGAMSVNWGMAEVMAYATLIDQGYPVRLTGQDVGVGTFSHRHAALHNQKDGSRLIPLNRLRDDVTFDVYDSLLSEEAVLAFEYGYATTTPGTLVVWEAQFGDFANGAQVVIDQFISSGETKWARLCGLTMLLPTDSRAQGLSIHQRGSSVFCSFALSEICRSACRQRQHRSIICCVVRRFDRRESRCVR